MKRQIKAGSTSQVLQVFVQDSASTTGAGKTGIVYNAAGLTCYYKRNTASGSTAVTLADITTLGTFVSGGFKAVDGTNMPGIYELHPPDAALASGAQSVVFHLRGAAGMADLVLEIELTAIDLQDGVSAGISRIDAAISSRSTVTTAQVNAEVVDVIVTDTHAEPSSPPAATCSLKEMLNWLKALARNKVTQTGTTQTLRNDADTGTVATSAHSDDGTTHTRGKWA